MKLNPDCIRDILITIESMEYGKAYALKKLCTELPQYSAEELNYHSIKLIEAGFLNADSVHVNNSFIPQISRIYDLTFAGHQFLANVRSDNIWNGVKSVGSKVGSVSLEALTQIASNVISELIKSQFGLH
jgi:hypothetical protein